MKADQREAPLLLRVQLTDDQRRQVLEQTGHDISALPYASGATAVLSTFGGIVVRVPRGVFVPTAATEHLLYAAIHAASGSARPIVVDVGTGSGVVALAAAAALPSASVFGTDVSELALEAARANRARLRLHNVRFSRGSLLSPLPRRLLHRVAVIVANIPYVPPRLADASEHAFPEGTAIGLGEDGLELVRQLADGARQFLMPGGSLVLQLADFQWAGFGSALTALGYNAPELDAHSINAPVTGRVVWPG
ncbi:MAG: 50S ribosomal protein L11 methyltransferase [Deltaproteobacteria bacterium]